MLSTSIRPFKVPPTLLTFFPTAIASAVVLPFQFTPSISILYCLLLSIVQFLSISKMSAAQFLTVKVLKAVVSTLRLFNFVNPSISREIMLDGKDKEATGQFFKVKLVNPELSNSSVSKCVNPAVSISVKPFMPRISRYLSFEQSANPVKLPLVKAVFSTPSPPIISFSRLVPLRSL